MAKSNTTSNNTGSNKPATPKPVVRATTNTFSDNKGLGKIKTQTKAK